jgi:large subunit ribosomal protein L30
VAAKASEAKANMAVSKASGLRVTWVRSTIGHKEAARGTIRALGLHRLNQTIEIADTPANRGMIRRVAFLLSVQEPAAKEGTSE